MIRLDKATTKVRIAFDGAARCDGVSLNDFVHAGPKLQRSIVDVLLRFQRYEIAIICDIAEMYLQIEVNPEDSPFQRFLWRGRSS